MLILGHAGLTLGAAVLLNNAFAKSRLPRTGEITAEEGLQSSAEVLPVQNCSADSKTSWLTSLSNRIDIRILLIGSLLPDIIDKPVGHIFFRDTFSNGRIFCHTLLFLIIITLAGFYLYRSRHKTWLLVLSFGTFTHLIFDQMWRTPRILLWPLYGFAFEKFEKIDLIHWTGNIFYALYTDPVVYVPELIGGVILVWFVSVLVRRRKLYSFIRNGRV